MATITTVLKLSTTVCVSLTCLCVLASGPVAPLSQLSTRIKDIINKDALYEEFTGRDLTHGEFEASGKLSLHFKKEPWNSATHRDRILDKLKMRFRSITNTQTRLITELRARTSRSGADGTLTQCALNLPGLKYDQDMQTEVSWNSSCVVYSPEVAPPGVEDRHLLGDVSAVVRDEENSPRWPRRTLAFTSLDGHSVFYPTLNVTADELRTAQRQWLRGSLHPRPKDIVLVYDASHSMTDRVEGGATPAAVVLKRTILSLLSTLSTRDRVAIVVSTGGAMVPEGDKDGHPGRCVSSKLAFVSKDLREYLQHQFIDSIQHSTPNVTQVYQQAFKYFRDDELHQALSNQGRERILLSFMASRNLAPTEYEACLRVVTEEQAALTGHIRLLGVSIKVQPAFAEPESHYKTDRLLFDISRSGVARTSQTSSYRSDITGSIKWFHQMFYQPAEHIFISNKFPKLGPTVQCCSHLRLQDSHRGLLCVLVPMVDVEADMGIPDYMSSYGFIVDSSGDLLLYPSLRPVQNPDYPVRIESLERSPEFQKLLSNITRGETVDAVITPGFIKWPRKGSPLEGTMKANLSCGPIRDTSLQLCLVTTHNDWPVSVGLSVIPDKFLYHRLEYDQSPPQETCQYYCAEVLPDYPTYMLTEKAFKLPKSYPGHHQPEEYVHHLVTYMQNKQQRRGNDVIGMLGIKEGVLGTYSVAADLATSWVALYNSPNGFFNAKWLYAGFINGVYVSFPGGRSDDSYDHTTRPWYMLAMSMPDRITFTRPYRDYGTDKAKQEYVISICKAVTVAIGGRDLPIAVLCLDHTMTHFKNVADHSLNTLCSHNKTCFFIDHEGYIVSHKDFMDINKEVLDTHIMDKEPVIAKLLLEANILQKSYCIDMGARREQPVWEVNLNGSSYRGVHDNALVIHEVQDTNIFLVVVNVPHHNRAADVGVCERQEKGCRPVYSYNCSCPAPIDGCDFVYHETSESSVLPFCSGPLYGRDSDHVSAVCTSQLPQNLPTCHSHFQCSLANEFRTCQDQGCRICHWLTDNSTLTLQCVADTKCPDKPTLITTPALVEEPTVTMTTTQAVEGGVAVLPPTSSTMYTLTIAVSVIVCLLFIIVLVYICCQYPRHNTTAPRLTPSPVPSDWDPDRRHDFDDISINDIGPFDDGRSGISSASSAATVSIYAYSTSSGSSGSARVVHKNSKTPDLNNPVSTMVSVQPSASGSGRRYSRQESRQSTLVRIEENEAETSGQSDRPQAASSGAAVGGNRDAPHIVHSYRL